MNNEANFITYSKLGSFGRLGNQLFQIAAVIGAARLQGVRPRFPRWYCEREDVYFSAYFKNKLDESLEESLIQHKFNEQGFVYGPVPSYSAPLDLIGYYQSEKYFIHCADEIRHYFEPEDLLMEQLQNRFGRYLEGQSCAIHIRRGDYVGSAKHEVCDMDYYNRCVSYMNDLGINKFLVFSDDITWCKEKLNEDFYFIEGNNTIEDLFLMSLCKHQIIANSTFSWWASWLNNNSQKVVCAPSKWFAEGSMISDYDTIYRNDMIKI